VSGKKLLGSHAADGALYRLYERLGFVHEGRKRDYLWFDGKYWDMVQLAMLEHEWRERYGGEEGAVAGASRTE